MTLSDKEEARVDHLQTKLGKSEEQMDEQMVMTEAAAVEDNTMVMETNDPEGNVVDSADTAANDVPPSHAQPDVLSRGWNRFQMTFGKDFVVF